MDKENEKIGHVPMCEAAIVVIDVLHDGGFGERARTTFDLWLLPPWYEGVCLKLEHEGREIGVAVFKATAKTRQHRQRTIRLFELVQVLPHGSALPFPQVRLTTFAEQLPEFASNH